MLSKFNISKRDVVMAALLIARMVGHRDSGESSDCAHGER